MPGMMTQDRLKKRILASQGKLPLDLLLKNVSYLDVFHAEFVQGDAAVFDGTVVGISPHSLKLDSKRTLDLKGKYLVPGFVDAHVHIESSMMVPEYFEKAVLERGTTSVISDPHEIANVSGVKGIQFFLESAEKLHLDQWVMLSSCVPATHMETNGGGSIEAEDLLKLRQFSKALGLAEVMNVPGVLNAAPHVLEKLSAFSSGVMDGHCPSLGGQALDGIATAGISTCHESSTLEEGVEKLSKGISVWIREGSVAKDLEALLPMVSLKTSTSLGFCTDDRNPLDIAEQGHIDYLVRKALQKGIAPEIVYRMASWSPARHYQLTQGAQRIGAIAPGYQADLLILEDLKACGIGRVLKKGLFVDEEIPSHKVESKVSVEDFKNSIRVAIPEETELRGPSGKVHVIGVRSGSILTEHRIEDSKAPGVHLISVIERYGKGSSPSNGYCSGFGEGFSGAIGSTVGHDSHNLVAVGSSPKDMRVAMSHLAGLGGGFCVVQNGNVLASLALPIAGLMTDLKPEELKMKLVALKEASRSIGCVLDEPFLQLAFLCLPVIPSLKITDQGLVDVDRFEIISVSAD